MSNEAAVRLPLDDRADQETENLKQHVRAYLRKLRFQDLELVEALTMECLHRARWRVGQDPRKSLRRAFEEAQHRLDQALARALGLHLPKDAAMVAAAKAALLLTQAPVRADDLIRSSPERAALLASLKAKLPMATPPEAPASMPTQLLKFWV